jgi:hypothetical protein
MFHHTYLIIFQIATKEALPLQEFAQNPFAVLCTTALGGHLSWFESGGERWFAKPVRQVLVVNQRPLLMGGSKIAKFLNLMARDVKSVNYRQLSERDSSTDNGGLTFQTMRRKLHIISDPHFRRSSPL